jgi:hypothetical protein
MRTYTPAEDARIRDVYALPHRSPERVQARAVLAAEIGVSPSAIKARWHVIRCVSVGRPRPPHVKQDRPRSAAPPQPLPVSRPAWMAPITREQLMARRTA